MFRVSLLVLMANLLLFPIAPANAQENSTLSAPLSEQFSQQAASFRKVIAELEGEIATLNETIREKQNELDERQASISAVSDDLRQIEETHHANQRSLEALESEMSKREAQHQEQKALMKEELDALEDEKSKIAQSIKQLQSSVSQTEAKLGELEAKHQATMAKLTKLEADLKARQSEFIATTELVTLASAQHQDLEEQAELLRGEMEALRNELNSAKETKASLEGFIAETDAARDLAIEQKMEAELERDDALIKLGEARTVTQVAEEEYLRVQDRLDEAKLLLDAAKQDLTRVEGKASEFEQLAEASATSVEEAKLEFATEQKAAQVALSSLLEEQASAEETLKMLLLQIDQAKQEQEEIQEQPLASEEVRTAQPLQRGNAKSATLVASALDQAPGLGGLAAEDQQKLQALLQDGVCVHEALGEVFIQVNRQTLLSLVRDLGRC